MHLGEGGREMHWFVWERQRAPSSLFSDILTPHFPWFPLLVLQRLQYSFFFQSSLPTLACTRYTGDVIQARCRMIQCYNTVLVVYDI